MSKTPDPRSPEPGDAETERRIEPRFECSVETECFSTALGRYISVRILNISRTGTGVVGEALPQQSLLIFDVPNLRAGPARKLYARVLHSVHYSKESWLAGCTFDAPLTDREFRILRRLWGCPDGD